MSHNLQNMQHKAVNELYHFLQEIEESIPDLEEECRIINEIELENSLPPPSNIVDLEQWEKESLADENVTDYDSDTIVDISELINRVETLQRVLSDDDSRLIKVHEVVPEFLEFINDYQYLNFPVSFEDAEENLKLFTIKEENTIYTLDQPNLIVPELFIPISNELLSLLAKEPNLLYKVPPRKFEEIIAEIFYRNGFEVELTKVSRDGGKDIIAFTNKLGIRSKYIIECKRYSKTNKVTLGLVQRLLGVKIAESANKAILATTSSFTRDAKVFAKNHVWDLDLKDFNGIISWIKATVR